MEFTYEEQIAIIKSIDAVMNADGIIHNDEMLYLSQLMQVLDFDSSFVLKARATDMDSCINVLKRMSNDSKQSLYFILGEMAKADGHVAPQEMSVIISIYHKAGFKLFSPLIQRRA